ncbi:MAG: division/cell wall cluster transcriptional repressor MraZ [Neisseriales bacterium]|nr:MAG: division/cell wall cluster transcriptional repressor MraZ [Neisseriales bacterium]
MFGGVNILNLDNKGRLAIPAKHREVLLTNFSPTLVVTLEAKNHLLIYPESQWRLVEQKLIALPVGNPMLKAYQRLMLGHAETLEMDGFGRILIPTCLRELVFLNKEVGLVGMGNRFELWNAQDWKAETEAALILDRKVLNMALDEFSL